MQTDVNGLYQMRARYYNPAIKRFVNRDVLSGSLSDGLTMNRYAYVNGNPVSYIDPFGLSADGATWWETGLSFAADVTPFVGTLKGIQEVFSGVDLSCYSAEKEETLINLLTDNLWIGGNHG
ncbi:RHS repeat-associated core domain-containing protein [Saccharibacillus brassicae]|uniref:RHS repeat-associated core domain-containing protein n=1 Tax=Saccharibacillus brassicae TaxID=2583377 RepID=UPI001FE648BD|nr:RHS repeat-associated core domain-containing protein [Saccharibacillus brassicae]